MTGSVFTTDCQRPNVRTGMKSKLIASVVLLVMLIAVEKASTRMRPEKTTPPADSTPSQLNR